MSMAVNMGLHKKRGISSLAKRLLASQRGTGSMEIVINIIIFFKCSRFLVDWQGM
jgi:hypothetical protein